MITLNTIFIAIIFIGILLLVGFSELKNKIDDVLDYLDETDRKTNPFDYDDELENEKTDQKSTSNKNS